MKLRSILILLLAFFCALPMAAQRRSSHVFETFEGKQYPVLDSFITVKGPDTTVTVTSIRYSSGPYHYPLEITCRKGLRTEKIRYTYPFCTPPGYGPVADSLLRRGMPWAILSKTRWVGSARLDSVSILYGTFGTNLRPRAVLHARKDASVADSVHLYLAWDPDGIQPTIVRNGKGEESRQLEPRLTGWIAPDPAEEHRREKLAVELCKAYPGIDVAPADGTCFLFGPDGKFLTRIDAEGLQNCLVKLPDGGKEPFVARFADPVEDPTLINIGTDVKLVSKSYILESMLKCKARTTGLRGLVPGSLFLLRFSNYGGELDFASNGKYGIYRHELYFTHTPEGNVAHNNFNFGNFLWGASAREAGVPLIVARLGAHFNNFFLSPDTKGELDSPDDQFSITCGHHWWR